MASACASYALVVWVLPVFMLPIVNVLPFVHERDLLHRLSFSVAGSLLIVASLVALDLRRIARATASVGSTWQKVKHRVGIALGLAMFTYLGADLSANTLGLAAKLLPGEPYRETVVLSAVAFSGSRYKSASVEYLDSRIGAGRYLVLSKRLFEYPAFTPGDVVELTGKSGPVGIYVNELRLVRRGLTGQSSGPPSAAADFQR